MGPKRPGLRFGGPIQIRETGREVGWVKFEDALQEILAVQVLPGARLPDLIHEEKEILASAYVVLDEALADVPNELRCWQKQ